MSDRSGKAIFAHTQTYSLKGNSKSPSAGDTAAEGERLAGACPHVPDPQPPMILEGMRSMEVVSLIERRMTQQNKVLRRLRKEHPDRKDELRSIRKDTHVLIASVFSFPDAVEEMVEEEYLPLSLAQIIRPGGRMAMIITNSWLGTDWGDAFYRELSKRFELKTVITSGSGRWFGNSEVVTNILIAERLEEPDQQRGPIKFVTLKRRIEDLESVEDARDIARQIVAARPLDDVMTLRTVMPDALEQFRSLGLSGSAQFVDCDWALDLPIIPLAKVAFIRRGERRGMNEFFYPKKPDQIEDDYLVPLAKDFKDLTRLSGTATRVAFSCSRSTDELEQLGHTGALNWITSHASPAVVGKLGRAGKHWYQMDTTDLSSMVASVGYDKRIFVGRLDPPAFCDQRLVPIKPAQDIDDKLLHALLNTTISMFLIEGLGFGRGLGVLDLNKDRMESSLHVLDPTVLDDAAADRILAAFQPLLQRDIMKVADELEATDRQAFDDVVLREFSIKTPRKRIYDALRALFEIRMAAIR